MENADACCAGNDRSGPQDRRRPVQIRLRDADRDGQGPQGPERRHHPVHLGQEGRAGLDARMAARRLSPLADARGADLGARPLSEDRFPGHPLLRRAEEHAGPDLARRRRSRTAEGLREARHSAEGAGDPGRRRRSRRVADLDEANDNVCSPRRVAVDAVFDSVSVVTTFKEELAQGRRHLLLDLGSDPRASGAGEEISRHGRADHRQLLRDAELGGLHRRLLRLRAEGRALPDGAVDLFPHQREEHRPVRAHADHRRGGRLRLLSRRLHGAAARREPAACGGGRAVALDDAEIKYSTVQNWYPGDAKGKGGIYNFVTKRGDCRGDRSKISWTQVETGSAITWKYPSCILRGDDSQRRVLFDRRVERLPAGRQRHQDDPSRQEHVEPHHLQGHRRRLLAEHLSRPGLGAPQGDQRAQLHQLRLAADRRPVRRAHRALYRGEERRRRSSSTRRRRRRFPRTRSSTSCSAAFPKKRRSR